VNKMVDNISAMHRTQTGRVYSMRVSSFSRPPQTAMAAAMSGTALRIKLIYIAVEQEGGHISIRNSLRPVLCFTTCHRRKARADEQLNIIKAAAVTIAIVGHTSRVPYASPPRMSPPLTVATTQLVVGSSTSGASIWSSVSKWSTSHADSCARSSRTPPRASAVSIVPRPPTKFKKAFAAKRPSPRRHTACCPATAAAHANSPGSNVSSARSSPR